jgi:hypothetical protein
MIPFRSRIGTMMISIALIAVLIGAIAASGFVRRIREASIRIEEASVWVRPELVTGGSAQFGPGTIILSHSFYVQIPLMSLVLLATIATGPISLDVHRSARWRRRAERRRRLDAS